MPAAIGPLAEATLDRLEPLLRRRPDLPGLSRATREVQRISRQEQAHLRSLVAAAELDAGLSARLLRLSNTAACASAGAGRNDSVDRAVRLLGFDQVRLLAMGLPLLDRVLPSRGHLRARDALLRGLLAARIARALCGHGREADAAHLAALYQNLGRLLLATHLPDDARTLHADVPPGTWPRAAHEDRASLARLGWRLPDLGARIARHWGWPESVRETMRRPQPDARRPTRDRAERLRRVAQTANDLADLLIDANPACWRDACADRVALGDTGAGQDPAWLMQALAEARTQLATLADLVDVPRSEQAQWQQADITAQPPPPEVAAPAEAPEVEAAARLHDGLHARRTVLWRAPERDVPLQPRHVLGDALPREVAARWRVDPAGGRDLFARLLRHGRDTLIHDARDPGLARHLPAAFRQGVAARSFMVLPLPADRCGPGLIYVDRPDHDPFTLDGDALRLVQTLRPGSPGPTPAGGPETIGA